MKNKSRKFIFKIRTIEEKDKEWVKQITKKHWDSEKIVSRGKIYYPHKLPGFVAVKKKRYIGLITYHIKNGKCEIISLNSFLKEKGVGTTLIKKVKEIARKLNCRKLWLITTNDNVDALKFYQKIGFQIAAIYPDAISLSRRLKPEIPKIGNYGIPIRDEIKLEIKLKNK